MRSSVPNLRQAIAACAAASLAIYSANVLADATNAADLFGKTCLASVGDLARIDVIAKENGWKNEDDQGLVFPLSKRGDALKRRSGWRGTWNGEEFVIVTGAEVTAYETTNACMILFKTGRNIDEFLAKIAISGDLRFVAESSAPQSALHMYEVQGAQADKPIIVMIESKDRTLTAVWAIREQ